MMVMKFYCHFPIKIITKWYKTSAIVWVFPPDVDSMWDDPDRPEYYTDDDGEIQRERVIFAEDEQISLALQLSPE